MGNISAFCLFGGGAFFAVFGGVRKRSCTLWPLLAALCVVSGVLSGLALGWTLEGLLNPVLVVCAAAMTAPLFGRGNSES